MPDLSRRAFLAALGLGAAGTIASWPRLTASDIPGRGSDALSVAILGTAQDVADRVALVDAFRAAHPDIPVRVQAIQGADWSNFFAKVLTLVAAGTPPDVCVVATEGTQLFADRLAYPLDEFVRRDAAQMQELLLRRAPLADRGVHVPGQPVPAADRLQRGQRLLQHRRPGTGRRWRPADDWTKDDFVDVRAHAHRGERSGGGSGPTSGTTGCGAAWCRGCT